MEAIIPLTHGLLQLGRDLLARRQMSEGIRVLHRLLAAPDVEPELAAEGSRLLAEAHFAQADFAGAKARAEQALAKNPDDAEAHFLLARAASEEPGVEASTLALEHYAKAADLDPADGRKRSAYGLQMVKAKRRKRGLAVLANAYATHPLEPAVVGDYADALFEAGADDDAELLVVQAAARDGAGDRMRRVRERVRQRLIQRRLSGESGRRSEARSIIPFRNFERSESERPRSNPRVPERTSVRRELPQPPVGDQPPILEAEFTLAETLKRFPRGTVVGIGVALGLCGADTAPAKRTEIVRAFADPGFVRNFVQSLEAEPRRLLRTLVKAGGFMPANVLFQNTGPDAPPPDYVQPLLAAGVCFFGREKPRRAGAESKLVALIPADIRIPLAKALRIKPGS